MIRVLGADSPCNLEDPTVVDTTSHSKGWSRGLSPFLLGPCPLYLTRSDPNIPSHSKNMENAWQFSKVYKQHLDEDGNPNDDYWRWARKGWLTKRGIRYPMGKGAIPEFSYWEYEKLGYIEARKRIYIPLYRDAVKDTEAYKTLVDIYRKHGQITLWGFDGYDHHALGKTMDEVINDPNRKMGHMFVLAQMLEEENA